MVAINDSPPSATAAPELLASPKTPIVVFFTYPEEPFGDIIKAEDTDGSGIVHDNPFRFSTKYFDEETGLVYYGLRFYSPELGRWRSRDPVGELGSILLRGELIEEWRLDVDEPLYVFVLNDPINAVDSYGLYTLREASDEWAKTSSCKGLSGKKLKKCQKALWKGHSDKAKFTIWLHMEKGRGSWWTGLRKCPKVLCLTSGVLGNKAQNPDSSVWADPAKASPITAKFHPGAAYEMRSNKSAGPHGNQCIYDSTGLIITKIPAAGSADWFGPNYSFSGHQGHDVKTYNLAKKLGRVSDYYVVRPVWTE